MGAFNPDNLIVSTENSPITDEVTLPAGTYERGTAIGKLNGIYGAIGETGYTAETVWGILAEEVSSVSAIKASQYVTGEFRKSKIIIKGTAIVVTAENLVDPARKQGIFLK